MRFYTVLRISSIQIPLVNLTNLCKKFSTRWRTCAKSTIFQICQYEAKLNGNNLNYIYNFRKFKLFPIVSVLLSSICVCCSYFPMQKFANIFPSTSSLVTSPTISLRLWMAARRCSLTRSPLRPRSRPCFTSLMLARARVRAS